MVTVKSYAKLQADMASWYKHVFVFFSFAWERGVEGRTEGGVEGRMEGGVEGRTEGV